MGVTPAFWPEQLVKWWHHFLSYRMLGRLNECILLLLLKGLCSLHLGQKTTSGEVLTGLLLGLSALRSVSCPLCSEAQEELSLVVFSRVPASLAAGWVWATGGWQLTGEWEEGKSHGISPLLFLAWVATPASSHGYISHAVCGFIF